MSSCALPGVSIDFASDGSLWISLMIDYLYIKLDIISGPNFLTTCGRYNRLCTFIVIFYAAHLQVSHVVSTKAIMIYYPCVLINQMYMCIRCVKLK